MNLGMSGILLHKMGSELTAFRYTLLTVAMAFALSSPVSAADPPVKKSNNNICHPKGGTYYKRTKN